MEVPLQLIFVGLFLLFVALSIRDVKQQALNRSIKRHNHEVITAFKDRKYPVCKKIRLVRCHKCNAVYRVMLGTTRTCDFCKTELHAPKE